MDLSSAALLAGAAGIGAFWSQIKNTVTNCYSLFIRTDTIESDYNKIVILVKHLLDNSKIVRYGNTTYLSDHYRLKNHFFTNLTYDNRENVVLLYKNKIPIFLKFDSCYKLKITYVFRTFNLPKILLLVQNIYDSENGIDITQKNRFRVYHYRGEDSNFDISGSPHKSGGNSRGNSGISPMPEGGSEDRKVITFGLFREYNKIIKYKYDDTLLEYDQKNQKNYYESKDYHKLLKNIEFWINSKAWYEERQIPWQRGVLLESPPGYGKTKMVIKCAEKLKIPVDVFELSNMTNNEFIDAWSEVSPGSIVLLEDFDSIFNKRENLHKSLNKNLISFDCLINAINGAKENNGIMLIITTNKIENIDSALLRPGRVDEIIRVSPLDDEGKKFIAENILKGYPDDIKKLSSHIGPISVVEFQNKCIQRALEIMAETAKESIN